MTVKARCTRVALNTATGNQDITISGLGAAAEIRAAIFLVTGAVTDATQATHAVTSWGLTDGTNHRVNGTASEDGNSGSDTKRAGATDEVILMINPTSGGGGSIDMEANFVSFITDGVRINIGNAGAAFFCTVVFIVGNSFIAKCGDVVLPDRFADPQFVVTPLPFQADVIFSIMNGIAAYPQTPEADAMPGIGFWSRDANDSGSVSSIDQDAQSTTDSDMRPTNNFAAIQSESNSNIPSPAISISDVTSSSFELVASSNPVSRETCVGFLALHFEGVVATDMQDDTNSPVATGDYDVTVGFTPQFVMQMVSDNLSMGCGYGLGVFDAANEFSHSFDSEDGVTTSNANSRADSKAVMVVDANDTVRFEGTFSSFLATAYRINYTTVQANGEDLVLLAIEEAPTLQYQQENFRWRTDDGSESAASWLQAEEVNITQPKSTNTRLRLTLDTTGADPPTATRTLQYIQKGDNPSEWRDLLLT